jgi:hypothetical protein
MLTAPQIGRELTSIPSETPMPSTVTNSTSGFSPGGGGPFSRSVMASTTKSRSEVAKNSEKKQDTFVMYVAAYVENRPAVADGPVTVRTPVPPVWKLVIYYKTTYATESPS